MTKLVFVFFLVILPAVLTQQADPSTLDGKVVFGYQGWFLTPSDGANVGWRHWTTSTSKADATTVRFDVWPEMSEYPLNATDLTNLTLPNGQKARLFSSHQQSVMDVHFKWLQQYNVDGVFLQRFLAETYDPAFFAIRNTVTTNMMKSAKTYGRIFSIMYDISGVTSGFLASLQYDWNYLVKNLSVTKSPQYQHHNGKPVVTVWGCGFAGRGINASEISSMITWFKNNGFYVIGGVPYNWRTLNGDSETDPSWTPVYQAFDALSPWTVGRFDASGVNAAFQYTIQADKTATLAHNQYYAPVLFPGFSWANMNPGQPFNQIPRNGGNFFWSQAQNFLTQFNRTKTFLYLAMFDEVDEGTAFLKMSATSANTPVKPPFVTTYTDGINDPADRYLYLAGQASAMFKNPKLPVFPANFTLDHLTTSGTFSLSQNECMYSASKIYALCLTFNGVLQYKNGTKLLWNTTAVNATANPGPYSLDLQSDGNVVGYGGSGPFFASFGGPNWTFIRNPSKLPFTLYAQNDGNLVLNDAIGPYGYLKVSATSSVKFVYISPFF